MTRWRRRVVTARRPAAIAAVRGAPPWSRFQRFPTLIVTVVGSACSLRVTLAAAGLSVQRLPAGRPGTTALRPIQHARFKPGRDRELLPVVDRAGRPGTSSSPRPPSAARLIGLGAWDGILQAQRLRLAGPADDGRRGRRVRCGAVANGRADYRAALDRAPASELLAGPPVPTPWDAGLATAMMSAGRAVMKERLLDEILDDMALP
jgi:hypothetical protein